MDSKVERLKTPEDCEKFAKNVAGTAPELAKEARRRAVDLRVLKEGATTDVEREGLQAVYAYEAVKSARKGRTIRASRTWPMIREQGIIKAIERVVDRPHEAEGFTALAEMGMLDYAFESVVLRHPEAFTAATVAVSRQRIEAFRAAMES